MRIATRRILCCQYGASGQEPIPLLRNEENMSTAAADDLKKIRFEFKVLGTASLMKEYLRNITSCRQL